MQQWSGIFQSSAGFSTRRVVRRNTSVLTRASVGLLGQSLVEFSNFQSWLNGVSMANFKLVAVGSSLGYQVSTYQGSTPTKSEVLVLS